MRQLSIHLAVVLFVGATCDVKLSPASAQTLLETMAGVKFCRTLKDDAQRLKCFDGLFADKAVESSPNTPEVQAAWDIRESKSPIDDSPQITAILPARETKAALILRCRENKTDALFSRQFVYLGAGDRLKVIVRIGDSQPIETMWSPSTDGRAVFAPSAIQFIRSLPDNGRLFIRAFGWRGETADGEFSLGNISDVRQKIAQACKWPSDQPKTSKK